MDTLPNRSQGYFENRLYRRICAMQKRKPGLLIISASGFVNPFLLPLDRTPEDRQVF
jgi:hypothetical protein